MPSPGNAPGLPRRELLRTGFAALGGASAVALTLPAPTDRGVSQGRGVDVRAFGARGDGRHDDAPAVIAARRALTDSGGTVLFPPGTYRCARTLDFDDSRSIQLRGAGGVSGGASQASILRAANPGAPLVSARSAIGLGITDLALIREAPASAAPLVDLSHGGSELDAQQVTIARCFLSGAIGRADLVRLSRAHSVSLYDCVLEGGGVALVGRQTRAEYSNVVRVVNCTFLENAEAHVRDPGQAWSFIGCTFEPLRRDPQGRRPAGAIVVSPGFGATATTVHGCWFGDADDVGDWIRWSGAGLSVTGCYISTGGTGIRLLGSSNAGMVVTGNHFAAMTTAIDAGEGNAGLVAVGNGFDERVGTRLAFAGAPAGSIYENRGKLSVYGPVLLGSPPAPSISSGQGSPEGRVAEAVGSLYVDASGTPGRVMWVKESTAGPTGWRAI